MSTVERILFVALVAAAASAFATLSFVVGLVIIVWLSGLEMTLSPANSGEVVAKSRFTTGCGPKRRAQSKRRTAAQSAEAPLRPAAQRVQRFHETDLL
jgi:hypothetical protein